MALQFVKAENRNSSCWASRSGSLVRGSKHNNTTQSHSPPRRPNRTAQQHCLPAGNSMSNNNVYNIILIYNTLGIGIVLRLRDIPYNKKSLPLRRFGIFDIRKP